MKKILAFFGLISLALGITGVFLPLLPTTPFILLSAGLFARSSSRLDYWLRNHKYLGKLIQDFQEKKGIPLQTKITALSLLWISILYATWVVASEKLWLQILLLAIATAVSTHLLRFKTKK